MRYPVWKLIPLLGIPGFGCLVLLQVQKDLSSTATAKAAESAERPVPESPEPEKPSQGPTDGHMASVRDQPAENPFGDVEPAGLDFRLEMPADETTRGRPVRTAAVENLKPVPTATRRTALDAIASDDPFGDTRTADRPGEDEPLPIIQPAGYESEAADKAAPAAPEISDFGADPFADLEPLAPNPHAAGLEERPEPAAPVSPANLLESDDPFAGSPADDAEEALPAEGATVPIDGGPSAGGAPAGDSNPFGLGETEPATPPASVEEPTEEEPVGPAPIVTPPAGESSDDEPEFEDDPFATVPDDPGRATEPVPSEESPVEEGPRPLPADEEEDFEGIGTVSPTDPRGPQHAEITVEKKAPKTATLGEPLVYEILVTNVGDSPARDVTVSDVIPKGTRLIGTIPRAEMTERSLVWKLDSLEPGKSSKIRIQVTPFEAGPIGSVATVNFVSEVAAKTEVIAPHLSLKVTAPPQVALGQPVDFRFEIANAGNAPAEKVLLRDVLPEGFKHPDGNDLEYEVGTLAPGKSQAVTLRAAAVKPGSFKNTAVVTAAGGLKTEAAAAVEVADRAVSVTRQGPKRRYVGRPAMYANVVKNGSGRPVRGVKVLEQVPEGMEFVSATHNGQFDPDKRTVAWQVGPLGPGQSQTLQVVLTAAAEGVQDSVVRVEEVGGSQAEVTSTTTVKGSPSLAPSMQGPDAPIAVGERAAFKIRVKNRGNADATGVTVTLSPSSELTFVATETDDSISGDARTPAVQVAALKAGESIDVVFVFEGASPGTARIRAEVACDASGQPLVRDEEITVVAPAP